jgi:3-oxoadipate enol-lactonase
MQFARLNGVTHHYQLIGSTKGRRPIVFVNSLGTDFRIWRDVVIRLAGEHPVLLYDKRGHGLSDVGPTPYAMELLASDLAALLDHVGISRAIICGVSVGGMIAQQLYAMRPDLVDALVLCDTMAKIGDDAFWNGRIDAITSEGIAGVSGPILERWFTPTFRDGTTADFDGYRVMLERQPATGYIATCVALRDADLRPLAPHIAVPTICIVGDQDGSTPPKAVADFAKTIPNARFEIIKACGHLPSIEQPEALTAIIRAFVSLAGSEALAHVTH